MFLRAFSFILAVLGQLAFVPLTAQAVSQSKPEIDSFQVEQVEQLDPGTDLAFTLEGTPGAKASVRVSGLSRNIPMEEVDPGVYKVEYTIKSEDDISSDASVVATLLQDSESTQARLKQPLVSRDETSRDETSFVKNLNPGDGKTISAKGRLFISGNFDTTAGRKVDTDSVHISLDGEDITDDAEITSNFFSYQPKQPLENGEHDVKVSAEDTEGEPLRAAWSFQVKDSEKESAKEEELPLEIVSPENNSQISSSGPVDIRGRSAPNIDVTVDVKANTSILGGFGVNRSVLNRTVRTDSKGNFDVSFQPDFALPGTRYEVKISAADGDQTREETLVLSTKK